MLWFTLFMALLTIAQVVITGIAIVVTVIFSILHINPTALIVVCLASIILLRFSEISSFTLKALGFEAIVNRAEKVTAEAQTAIEALRVLSRNLSHAVLELQGMQGREDAVITLIARVHFRGALENNLLGLGYTPHEIAPMFERFDFLLTSDLFSRAMHFVPESLAKGDLKRELDTYAEIPKLEELKAIFQRHNVLYSDVEMLLVEADRYRRFKQVDPEKIK